MKKRYKEYLAVYDTDGDRVTMWYYTEIYELFLYSTSLASDNLSRYSSMDQVLEFITAEGARFIVLEGK